MRFGGASGRTHVYLGEVHGLVALGVAVEGHWAWTRPAAGALGWHYRVSTGVLFVAVEGRGRIAWAFTEMCWKGHPTPV